jgi:plasmid stabilization system protein ParE
MNVTWSRRALRQLRDAGADIAKDNLTAAHEFLEAAEALTAKPGEFPGIGIETGEPRGPLPLPRHRCLPFHDVRGEEMRIRHASRARP